MRLASLRNSLRPALACFALLLMCSSVLAKPQSNSKKDRNGPRRAVLLVDPAWIADEEVRKEIDAYAKRVQLGFGYELEIEPVDTACEPSELRKQLARLRKTRKIRGALLAGNYTLPVFQNACGDKNALYAYFGDVDGDFEQVVSSSMLDRYDPWKQDRDEVMELWISILRPFQAGQPGGRGLAEIAALFRRFCVETPESDEQPQATLLATKDWTRQANLTIHLDRLFGSTRLIGAQDASGARSDVGIEEFREALESRSEMLFVFAHSSPAFHQLDKSGSVVARGGKDGDLSLETTALQSRAVVLWGCHGLDLCPEEVGTKPFLADAYLQTHGSRAEVVLGASRSIGMEALDQLVPRLADEPLCDAWLEYLNHVYSEQYLERWLGVRNAWEKERLHFDWGYVMYGNPFVRFSTPRKSRQK